MVPIGYRPILWHVMRYYAHFGHRDFILCLGYRADAIKEYFLHYNEAVSNDFVLSERRPRHRAARLATSTTGGSPSPTPGLDTTIGERLRRVRHLLEGEEMFLANYGDTLTDAPLDRLVDGLPRRRTRWRPSWPSGRPTTRSTSSTRGEDGRVRELVRPARRRPVDQRRLLHPPPRDLRLHPARATSSWRRRSRG